MFDRTDGTPIAVWVEGDGPALVMVRGSIADHTTFEPFVQVLRDDLTTYSMDRRDENPIGPVRHDRV
jgi:hypothetical protein